ncbi:hypothetical protein [Prosthecobacter sp.]|uniref:SRPBCC family protein n=1 Tax=Prosthecobacter sp. TaxID=1965333 RepID=UPI002ABB5248|nr:hypothetical protein [Prosthecobacter sp.]MDZ4403615.1 hypothetical protein [Prosthecobacter sp.]
MKTKRYHPLRKHMNHVLKRRHAPTNRTKTGVLLRRVPPPIKPQAEAPIVAPPPQIGHERPDDQHNGVHLVRSIASDEAAACLIMSIEVPVPFTLAYEMWTKFDLPYFMKGTTAPEHFDGGRMTWCVRTLFDQFAWQAKACEVVPFERIAWKSVFGAPHPNFGSVSFEPINDHRTWVIVQVGFDMSGIYQWLGSPLPSISQSLERSLLCFHDFLTILTQREEKLLPAAV